MKIIIDARLYGLENTGIGRYILNLINNLARIDKNNQYTLLLSERYFNKLSLPDNFSQKLVNIKHYSISEQLKLSKILKGIDHDLVHFPHFNTPLNYSGAFIVTIHDMLKHKFTGSETTTQPLPVYLIKRVGYKKVFKNSIINSRKIIVPSLAVKEDIERFYKIDKNKINVTYEGVDVKLISSKSQQEIFSRYKIDKPYFMYVGNAYLHKNLQRAIEAIVYLNKQKGKECLFVLSSARNIFTNRLEEFVNKVGAGEYVRLIGYAPDDELSVLHKKSVGFLYPSLDEGFGLPGLEAMACGTVAVVSDIPVFKEIYKNKVIYFNPYDFSAIAMGLEKALNMDLKTRKLMVTEGKEFVKNYSWKKMAEETLVIYEKAISSNISTGSFSQN